MRIAFFCDHSSQTLNFWSIDNITKSVKETYPNIVIDKVNQYTDSNILNTYDTVIFYRCLQYHSSIISKLKQNNKKIGFAIDDLLWRDNQPYYNNGTASVIHNYFNMCDYKMIFSEMLNNYTDQSKYNLKLKCGLNIDYINMIKPKVNKSYDKLKVLINKGHIDTTFVSYMNNMLDILDINLNKNIEIILMSNNYNITKKYKNITFSVINQQQDIFKYFKTISDINPHVVLFPLNVTEFNNCKCPIKYIEAGALKSCIIAPGIIPYNKSVKVGNTGMICNELPDYIASIVYASNNIEEIITMGLNAHNDILANYNMNINCKYFIDEIKLVLNR